jgi:hypothetical protein
MCFMCLQCKMSLPLCIYDSLLSFLNSRFVFLYCSNVLNVDLLVSVVVSFFWYVVLSHISYQDILPLGGANGVQTEITQPLRDPDKVQVSPS